MCIDEYSTVHPGEKDSKSYCHPLEQLIEVAPEVAELALNNCISFHRQDKEKEYTKTYNFELLELDPTNQSNYFAPAVMVHFKRDNLLAHPLTVKFIDEKWKRFGKWMYFISLLAYLLFVSMLTSLVLMEKEKYVIRLLILNQSEGSWAFLFVA